MTPCENIDWSKAPEGATHYQPKTKEFIEGWYREKKAEVDFMAADDNCWMRTPSIDRTAIPRPLKPELDGTIPELEVTWGNRTVWYPGVKLPDGYFAYRSVAGVWRTLNEPDAEFRPIRTERDKAIEGMASILASSLVPELAKANATALYDAGYRKPQHKEG